jgi:hypothetical protein
MTSASSKARCAPFFAQCGRPGGGGWRAGCGIPSAERLYLCMRQLQSCVVCEIYPTRWALRAEAQVAELQDVFCRWLWVRICGDATTREPERDVEVFTAVGNRCGQLISLPANVSSGVRRITLTPSGHVFHTKYPSRGAFEAALSPTCT